MTPPTESLLSAEQRERIEGCVADVRFVPGRLMMDDVKAVVAEVSRLTALADDLSAMLYDHLAEHSPLIERLVAAEREGCAAIVEASYSPVRARSVAAIRARGPTLPPLPPWRYKEENAALRAMLERLVILADPDARGADVRRLLATAIEAARALLEAKP